MATLQKRKSHGQNYWYIVESRRVNGKPRPVMLAYLGRAEDLLARLNNEKAFEVQSCSHGEVFALASAAKELDIVNIINKHIPPGKSGKNPTRDGLSVGASLLLAAIGRSCRPTSKKGWYEWCRETSLEQILSKSFSKLDSQHFWEQMEFVPEAVIDSIEDDFVKKLVKITNVKLDCLFFDTTNFFTYIDSMNDSCDLPQRGHNKQKRFDLRQVGMSLLVSKQEQFPLFHETYKGNKNDSTNFKEVFSKLSKRIKHLTNEMSDITLVFDKGNNSKENFNQIDSVENFHYVAGLIPSHFKDLIANANKNFETMLIEEESIPVFRIKKEIWGVERTCVITVSAQLKQGQIQGIHQHLEKKYKALIKFKNTLESPKRKARYTSEEIEKKVKQIIHGQFIDDILKYQIITLSSGQQSFTYSLDYTAFDFLKENILGRKIHVTNRHDWSNEEICLAYRGQSKVEAVFRNLKNPYHSAIRPQYHWTDQKIKVHFLTCIIGYLLTSYVYSKLKKSINYSHSIHKMMEDLHAIRLTTLIEKKEGAKGLPQTDICLEKIRKDLVAMATALDIQERNFKIKISLS